MISLEDRITIYNSKNRRFAKLIEVVESLDLSSGEKGEKGDKGDTGLQGLQGLKGDKGDKGDIGLSGADGSQGIQGVQGNQGAKGDRGDKGDQGETGLQGLQGEQGVQGVEGEKGDMGNGFDIAKVYPSIDAMESDFSNPDVLIHSFVLINSEDLDNGKLFVKNETQYSFQSQLTGVKGEKGDRGEQGVQGIAGVQGAVGVRGLQGLKGDQGEQGLVGQQGIQGAQGIRGIQGEKGDTGERGLQGIQGVAGVQGLKGDKGDRGDTGATGVGALPTLNGIYQMPISTKNFYVDLPSQTGVNKVRLIVSGYNQESQVRIGFGGSSTAQPIGLVYGYYLTASYTDLNKIKTGRANNTAMTNTVLYPTDTTVLIGYGDIFDAVVTNQTTLESWTVRISGVVAKPNVTSTAGRLHVFIQKVFDNATQTVQTGNVY